MVTCALAITSSSQIAQFQLTNEITTKVAAPANKPALTKAKGILRNPVPTMKFSMKKKPRNMLTVFGWSSLSSCLGP